MAAFKGVRIIGTGSFLPPREVTNEELAKYLATGLEWETKDFLQWMEKYFGIKTRRFAFDPVSGKMDDRYHDGELAYMATAQALEMAGLTGEDLDLIIRITCTPEYLHFPDSACMLHGRLNASRDCAAFSLDSGCGGLMYALNIARGLIRGNGVRRVLVVPSNTSSPFHVRWDAEDPGRQLLEGVIFGDGASALVLEGAEENERGILDMYWGAWPVNDPMSFPAGGSRNPSTAENARDHEYRLNAKAVKSDSPVHFEISLRRILAKTGFSERDISWFLFHQVNYRILDQTSKQYGIPWEKMLVHVDRYGNTSAASIGILLDEAVRDGTIKDGDLLLMVGVGSGWQYGAALVRW